MIIAVGVVSAQNNESTASSKEMLSDNTQKDIIKNPNNKKDLEKELNKNIKLLESDIVYDQYNMYLSEVNNMLAIFENKLKNYFSDVFN